MGAIITKIRNVCKKKATGEKYTGLTDEQLNFYQVWTILAQVN